MTPSEINTIADRHLDLWFADGPAQSHKQQPTLRDRCADMIREALTIRDRNWADGNATLRHERDRYRAALVKVSENCDRPSALYDDVMSILNP